MFCPISNESCLPFGEGIVNKMKLKEKEVEVGNLYLTTANQYRAVLAMKGEFMIYAPSLEGTAPLSLHSTTIAARQESSSPQKR